MKKSLSICFAIILLTCASFGQKQAAAKIDPAQGVHEAFDRFVEGIKQVDVDKVMSSYAKGSDLLVFNNNGTATKGWDNVNDSTKQVYAKLSNVSLDITGLNIRMMGKAAAYVTCKWKQSQENDGKLENASGRMTLVYQLVGKDWKIVHRHTSPDKPDATRPVFQSERQP
ncbi:MAG TPA: nuclear transport factor 2 family protein [Pyrinomonadaceae bacterium]|jgi:ketosteroid isomerase-like protein|nr:nuclear transport factor 2 family protein [Pyrinomonadaceae bacterium]